MSLNTTTSSFLPQWARIAVPATTTFLGLLGASTGLYSFLYPGQGPAEMFGIYFQPSSTINSSSSSSQAETKANSDTEAESTARTLAYIRIYGIRNFSNGLGLLSLLSFWKFSSISRAHPEVAGGVLQKAVALLMATGSWVGLIDGMIVRWFGRSDGVGVEAKELARERERGHIFVTPLVLVLACGWWVM